MLILFVVAERLLAFHGPYPTQEKHPKMVNKYFPCFYPTIPFAFQKNPYMLGLWTSMPQCSASYLCWIMQHTLLGLSKSKDSDNPCGRRLVFLTLFNSRGMPIYLIPTSSCLHSSFGKAQPIPFNFLVGCWHLHCLIWPLSPGSLWLVWPSTQLSRIKPYFTLNVHISCTTSLIIT